MAVVGGQQVARSDHVLHQRTHGGMEQQVAEALALVQEKVDELLLVRKLVGLAKLGFRRGLLDEPLAERGSRPRH